MTNETRVEGISLERRDCVVETVRIVLTDQEESQRKEWIEVSYFIIEQEGSAPRVAEKTLEMHWDNASLRLGAIVGTVFGFYLRRRLMPGEIDGQLRVGRQISRTAVEPDT